MIIHLTDAARWDRAKTTGDLHAESLLTDGFAHCSTPAQIIGVANRFFRGSSGLVLLAIDESLLTPPLKWEPPAHPDGSPAVAGEAEFPHVYGPINLDAVTEAVPLLPMADGGFTEQQLPSHWL